jgi:hypothetical protein
MGSHHHPDRSPDAPAEGAQRPGPSRRSVLQGAAGLAGAGLAATALAGTLATPAAAAAAGTPRAHPGRAAGKPSPADPVIVHIRDLRSGEMDVFAGEATARFRDPELAARLVHTVR